MSIQGFFKKAFLAGIMIVGICGLGGVTPANAQKPVSSYAILVVGDESKAEVSNSEKKLISEISTMLESKTGNDYNYPKVRSSRQVYSYHLNKEQEKVYCENKLDILSEDILFVGIIEIDSSRYPKRIVYRLDRVVNTQRSAKDILGRIEDFMKIEASGSTASAATSPVVSVNADKNSSSSSSSSSSTAVAIEEKTSTASSTDADNTSNSDEANVGTSPESRYEEESQKNKIYNREVPKNAEIAVANYNTSDSWRCQVGAFSSVDNARECYSLLRSRGHEGRIERLEIGDKIVYKVFVGTFGSRDEAVPTLNRLKDDGFKTAYICAPTR